MAAPPWRRLVALRPGRAAPRDAPHPPVAPGYVVPEFTRAGAWTARRAQVAFPKGSATVLLFFLSSCPTCHKMIPEWNRAYQRRPKNVNVVGVILDREPPGFFEAYPVAFPVVRSPGREFLARTRSRARRPRCAWPPAARSRTTARGCSTPSRLGEYFRP